MKGAIVCADKVSTVSPSYAEEIKYDFFSHGLSPITNMFAFKTLGILNGIDVNLYNSSKDKYLFENFTATNMAGKKVCKKELQKMLCLPEREDVPVIAMISRLVSHKGLDLVKAVVNELLCEDVQLVILGKGEAQYEEFFKHIQEEYSGKCRTVIAYNKDLSSKIYSGSDIFLMPSKQEPCGLSQMIACRYGTVPVVRSVGGLKDSITPYNIDRKSGNGFSFNNYNAHEMLYVLKDAIFTYHNTDEWAKIVKCAMKTDFSWKKSSLQYEQIYNELL
jgi:starch synthase